MHNIWPIKENISTTIGKTVFVGLSGGVDSAVSAALLQRQGYNVVGVFIRIALPGYPCSAGIDRLEAMRVAAHLRIPFKEIDLSASYETDVFRPSLSEYVLGRTPNPDVLCNKEIKFGKFYDYARAAGADFVATGHYAQTQRVSGRVHLLKGKDQNKDQSYFLWMVPEDILDRVLFPVGHLKKDEVRALAATYKLPNRNRKDSQGLCFLGDISMNDMLTKELAITPGDVLSEEGVVVGSHRGAVLYTLGERHGFTLHTFKVHTEPHYVVAKNIEANTITVSKNKYPQAVVRTEIVLEEQNWIGNAVSQPCVVRFRYRQPLIEAELNTETSTAILLSPHYVPTGQSLVVYLEERCVGGGIIAHTSLI